MRTLIKIGVVVVLLFGAYIGWSVMREREARQSAAAFCARFPVGSAMADATAAARDEGHRMFRRLDKDQVRVGYIGMYPFSRHYCTLDGQAGKVTRARLSRLD